MPVENPVQVLQLIAYSTLTFASVTVASIALYLAYWHQIGGKPHMLVLGTNVGFIRKADAEVLGTSKIGLICSFEIWNLRKYPIVIRKMVLRYPGMPIDKSTGYLSEKWFVLGEAVSHLGYETVGPTAQLAFDVNVPIPAGEISKRENADFILTVLYFDPRLNKVNTLRETGPIEGWAENHRNAKPHDLSRVQSERPPATEKT